MHTLGGMNQKHGDEDWQAAAQRHPEEAVDALEERFLGRAEFSSESDQAEPTPAIEQDLDSNGLGSAEAGEEPPD